jgi:hypothetical protein
MTLSARRNSHSGRQYITFSAHYGPASFSIDEEEGHVLQFWHELGKLVAVEDNERRAKAGYERYCEHFAGRVEFGAMSQWAELHEDTRGDWIAAFTE